jgi:hypothetical protein
MYHDILVTVEPKRAALRAVVEQQRVATLRLDEINARVAELRDRLASLSALYEVSDGERDCCSASRGHLARIRWPRQRKLTLRRWFRSDKNGSSSHRCDLTRMCQCGAAFVVGCSLLSSFHVLSCYL